MGVKPWGYPYLFLSLGLLALFFFLYWLRPASRRAMLLSALLSAPYAFASLAFVPRYWEPVRVIEWITGLEDLAFSFANGGLVWFTSGLFLSPERPVRLSLSGLGRYLRVTLAGIGLSFVWCLLDSGVMNALLLTTIGLVLFFLLRRPARWRTALCGGLGFTILYLLVFKAALVFCPRFIDQWNPAALSGLVVFRVPLEELLWAMAFGSFWPLFMAFVLLEPRASRPGPDRSRLQPSWNTSRERFKRNRPGVG